MPSTVVAAMTYNKETATLKVTYVSGKIYAYQNVPEKVYAAMCAASSKGKFLNERIKGHYPFKRINS